MYILFDQGTPVPLRRHLREHVVETAYERGRSYLVNGDLLDRAERAGFELLLTTDRNLRYQQNLASRRLSILVLTTTSWPRIQRNIALVLEAVEQLIPNSYGEIVIP